MVFFGNGGGCVRASNPPARRAGCRAGCYTRRRGALAFGGFAASESSALCPGGGVTPAPEANRGVLAVLAVSSWLLLELPRFPAERGDVRGSQALGRVGRVKKKAEPLLALPPSVCT